MRQSTTIKVYDEIQGSPLKDNRSIKTQHSNNASPSSNRKIKQNYAFFSIKEARTQLFEAAEKVNTISAKMSKKSINWMISICWSKDFSEQCLWTSLLLFYAYKSKISFDKTQLQAIILVCLQLSSKFYEPTPLTTTELLSNCHHPISNYDLKTIQGNLLQLVDFNLVFDHCLSAFLQLPNFSLLTQMRVIYLCQLYLINDSQLFFDLGKFMRIVGLVEGNISYEECQLEYLQIREMILEKESKILVHKFGGKFDVDSFLHQFL